MSTVKNDKVFARSIPTLHETYLQGCLLTPEFVAALAASLAAQQSLPPQPASIEGAAAHVYKTISGVELRLQCFPRTRQTVPDPDVERFGTESRALGNQCELIGYEGAPHGFFNPGRGGTWHSDALHEMDAFLTRLGYLAPGSSPRRQ